MDRWTPALISVYENAHRRLAHARGLKGESRHACIERANEIDAWTHIMRSMRERYGEVT